MDNVCFLLSVVYCIVVDIYPVSESSLNQIITESKENKEGAKDRLIELICNMMKISDMDIFKPYLQKTAQIIEEVF